MKLPSLVVIAVCTLAANVSLAQSDQAERKIARTLGNEGIDLYEKGDYAAALDRLSRAYAVLKVPTLGLWLARALVHSGQLVEASETYLEVERAEVDEDAPVLFREAQAAAAEENQQLQGRIPTLVVQVEGADPNQIAFAIDGKPVKSAVVGVPLPLNPGVRTIEGTLGAQTATETVSLSEGGSQSITLRFAVVPETSPSTGIAPVSAATADDSPAAGSQLPPTAPEPDRGADGHSLQRTLGWVAMGAGGVGLIVGGVSGALVLSKKSELDEDCQDTRCPPRLDDERESYNTMRVVSSAGFIAGGLLVGTGAVLLLTTPSQPASTAGVYPWVGLTSAGVKGVF